MAYETGVRFVEHTGAPVWLGDWPSPGPYFLASNMRTRVYPSRTVGSADPRAVWGRVAWGIQRALNSDVLLTLIPAKSV